MSAVVRTTAVVASVLLGTCMPLASSHAAAIGDVVQSESGFEGAVEIAESGTEGEVQYITVNVPYLDVRGQKKMGQGRLIVATADLDAGKKLPVFAHVHYEKDLGGAAAWCKRGWAVATAHYGDPAKGGYALELPPGDSFNLAKALLQWVRRLPIADRSRLHIDGGSAGGYMTLAMAAENFPVTAATADMPVVNWAYNLNYFERNKKLARYGETGPDGKPINPLHTDTPYLSVVTMLTDWAYGVFGKDLASDTYYLISPIAYLDQITAPTLVMGATGDMLVPAEQFTREHLYPFEATRFPEGYTRDFDALAPSEKSRHTLVELLGDRVETIVLERPEEVKEYTLAMARQEEKPPQAPTATDRPWSKSKPWTLVLLDEGPPLPYSPHSRYHWPTSPDTFAETHRTATPSVELLTSAKLDGLLRRYTRERAQVPTLADGTPANRLNFERLEKLDVVTGLLDYAAYGAEHEQHLKDLYGRAAVKPLGETLDLDKLREEQANLSPAKANP